MKAELFTILMLGANLTVASNNQTQTSYTDIHCGTVLDVESQKILKDRHILVQNNHIVEVGKSVDVPVNLTNINVTKIDLTGSTCLPGLFDTHAHLAANGKRNRKYRSNAATGFVQLHQAQATLKDGFTTLRSVGEPYHYSIVDLKHAIDQGKFDGPRLHIAPHMWSPTGGHSDSNDMPTDLPFKIPGSTVPSGTHNVRETVREEIKNGADWIKIAASGGVMSEHDDVTVAGFTQEEINAFADEVHRYKKKITSHIHGNAAAVMVARAGFDSIEHGTMIEDDAIELMIENGVWLVPTVWIVDAVAARCTEKDHPQRPSESSCQKIMEVKAVRDISFKKAYKHGVKMAFGVDAIYGVQDNPKEFSSLVNLGVSEFDAIQMATINSATMLGVDKELGSISKGKLADIIAVPGNPLKNIRQMEHVNFVMKDGKIIRND